MADDSDFGTLMAGLMQTLPSEASSLFLSSLTGLSTAETQKVCFYLSQLKGDKQFRALRALSESSPEGKKVFIGKIGEKIEQKQAKQEELDRRDQQAKQSYLQSHNHRTAVDRVKHLNGGGKHHSYNAALGAHLTDENPKPTHASTEENAPPNSRSYSISALQAVKEEPDIAAVNKLLKQTSITRSEQQLRELEVSSFASKEPTDKLEQADQVKRDRSINALKVSSEKPTQRVKVEEEEEAPSTKRWTKAQDEALRDSVQLHGEKNWKAIAELVPGRNHAQCLQRWRKVLKPGLVKGHWSFEEDQILEFLVKQGCHNWGQISERIQGRTPKQCRERWKNHLDPNINKGPYTPEEDEVIWEAQKELGNKWSQIAQLLKGRTEDSVKIRWKSLKQHPQKAVQQYQSQSQLYQTQMAQMHMQDHFNMYSYDPMMGYAGMDDQVKQEGFTDSLTGGMPYNIDQGGLYANTNRYATGSMQPDASTSVLAQLHDTSADGFGFPNESDNLDLLERLAMEVQPLPTHEQTGRRDMDPL